VGKQGLSLGYSIATPERTFRSVNPIRFLREILIFGYNKQNRFNEGNIVFANEVIESFIVPYQSFSPSQSLICVPNSLSPPSSATLYRIIFCRHNLVEYMKRKKWF
jgi:hypothetical protein